MRDFRDAKAMARALRDALQTKGVETTHSESLELIATAFGYENWNVLSAKIEAAATPASEARSSSSARTENDPAAPKTLYCSFCGKSQHEVRKLVAGQNVFICDECVELTSAIVFEPKDDDKELFRLLKEKEETGAQAHPALLELARGLSTEELAHYVESSKRLMEGNRRSARLIQRILDNEVSADVLGLPRDLRDKDRLVALQQERQRELRRYEDALRVTLTVLGERRQ
jgi:hypothetical protein